uniref:Amino acid transporter transmembrane domain-containing protein n=1 Tax=Megaselia scalaris TaxID=36166 RepID=T1GGR6_MEGSC
MSADIEKNSQNNKSENVEKPAKKEDPHGSSDHPTSYAETMMHMMKGNVGAGLFAMGDAFKNGGIVVSPFLTLILAVICVHCEHILVIIAVAEAVPKLGLFISLIGSLCSTALALIVPSLLELIVKSDKPKGPGRTIFIKNSLIILLGFLGTVTGTYQSLSDIIAEFFS